MHRFLLALALVVIVQPTAAQNAPNSGITFGAVKLLSANETSFDMVTDTPVENPAHCPTIDRYRSQGGLHYATVLTAFTNAIPVRITVHRSECADGAPKIVNIIMDHRDTDLAARINAISNHLDTIEQRVSDVKNQTDQIAQRADQIAQQDLAQENQIASKVGQVEQILVGLGREISRDSSGRTLINLVGSIAQKVGAP